MSDVVLVEADGPVRTVTLNRPDELNAVDADLHRALAEVWGELAALARALGGAVPAGFAAEAVTMASEEHRRRLLRLGEGGR